MHAGRVIVFIRYALNHKYPNEMLWVYAPAGREHTPHTSAVGVLAIRPEPVLFCGRAKRTLRRCVSDGLRCERFPSWEVICAGEQAVG